MTLKRLYKVGKRFIDLDPKLLAAITDKAHGELGREITQKIEEYAKQGKMFRGRQALFMVYQAMKVSEQAGALFDITDLMAVRLNGDKLEGFLNSWDATLTGMRSVPDPQTKEALFLKQVKRSESMKVEIAHYERHEIDHPDHSYEFLLSAVKRIIQKRRQDANRKNIEDALGGGKGAALPAKGKGKAKGICYEYRDTGKCTKPGCTYSHGEDSAPAEGGKGKGKRGRSRSRSSSKGKGRGKRGRSNTPPGKGKGKSGKSRSRSSSPKKVCWFYLNGHCKFGKSCNNLHEKEAAPAEGGGSKTVSYTHLTLPTKRIV